MPRESLSVCLCWWAWAFHSLRAATVFLRSTGECSLALRTWASWRAGTGEPGLCVLATGGSGYLGRGRGRIDYCSPQTGRPRTIWEKIRWVQGKHRRLCARWDVCVQLSCQSGEATLGGWGRGPMRPPGAFGRGQGLYIYIHMITWYIYIYS